MLTVFRKVNPVVGVLRFIGLVNAAVWFGGLVFFTLAVGPAFFSESMLALLGRPHAGAAAQIVLSKYFSLQIWCAVIAIAHLIAEWLYTARPFQRFALLLLMGLFTIALLGGFVLQPKMKDLHLRMYAVQSTEDVRTSADRAFKILHGTSMVLNLLVISGVLVYLWHVAKPVNTTRFASVTRFRT